MSRKTVTYLVDDLDGSEITEGGSSTTFALNGQSYLIDLGPDNVRRLEEALAPYIEKARRTSGGGGGTGASRTRRSASGNSAQFLSAVREWASSNGYTVGERGRVKAEVLEAYRAAH